LNFKKEVTAFDKAFFSISKTTSRPELDSGSVY